MAAKAKTAKIAGKSKALVKITAALLAGCFVNPAPVAAGTLSCPQNLLFGNYTTCNSPETSTITPNNTRTTTGCLSAGAAPFNRAQCNISQSFPPSNIQVSVTATKYNMTNTTTAKIVVDSFKCRFVGTSATKSGGCSHTSSGFAIVMDIGARMNIANPQASGAYSGIFTVQTNFP